MAQDDRYRVEILVLTHLGQPPEPRESPWIPDYSAALDFLTPPEPEEESVDPCAEAAALDEEPEASAAILPSDTPETGPDGELVETAEQQDGETAETEEEPDPNAVFAVTEMSDTMQEVWRRLRLSAPFRPQQYLSWEQGSNEPFPRLRLHDLEVVDIDDPWARERFEREQAEILAAQEETEKATEEQAAEEASEQLPDCPPAGLEEPPEEPELPEPTLFYRLDGTVELRRSRFLHLDLDLQWREALFEEPEAGPGNAGLSSTPPPPQQESVHTSTLPGEVEPAVFVPARRPTSFLVRSLKQTRQVRTGQLEYFDGPVLSVLALINRVETTEADSEQP